MLITEAQNRATGDFVELVAAQSTGRAVHPETAIASAARLSGSLLLRSFGFDLASPEPGAILLSDEANEKGPILVNLVVAFLQRSGIALDPTKLGGSSEDRGAEPHLSTLQSLSLLQEDALEITSRHSLSLQEAAEAAALATAFIVKECARAIGAETAFNVAAYGFIEGAKTAPPPISVRGQSAPKRPWYKFW